MADRIAIKRLAPSDCCLFDAVYKKTRTSGQKCITLNSDVLVSNFYPIFSTDSYGPGSEVKVSLSIYGPSGKGAEKVTRKIVRSQKSKNWRLNGETVHGPSDDPTRYDGISKDDIAIMKFVGDDVPSAIDITLVVKGEPADASLYATLNALFDKKSMIVTTPEQLAACAAKARVSEAHPIYFTAADPAFDSALEDAGYDGYDGTGKLLKSNTYRKVTASVLAKARARASVIGQEGEGLIDGYLASRVASGYLESFNWVAAENAISPFDFVITDNSGARTLIDVKTTAGPFENAIHISLAEIIEATEVTPYRIYRVFDIDADGGKLRVSDPINEMARNLRTIHDTYIPAGIRVDSFSLDISRLSWSEVETIVRSYEEDED